MELLRCWLVLGIGSIRSEHAHILILVEERGLCWQLAPADQIT